ncbi:MAG: 23S rRNA (pseudouridine(1915)-N(3))-methyltransferase RlmH [Dictyoglomus sp.]|nr:23S rRNA (pseudouridine(1915)-N(3))-methyltransferase RlmH [Dictyoglomus sp.]MCX7941655.1 23S rRNA (pseudouridine(1915)-N(3))-methyltransferase RlmH [Dictyoglomaceae bacterium]MDW8188193.1 23S rRNA (pseudouridine(1915)-N(3))-methyltransferase RlmH [Dictyoglomus sp.]
MVIKVLLVGKIRNDFIINGVQEYVKRIKAYSKIEIINITNFTNLPPPQALLREEELIKKHIRSSYTIVLDKDGILLNSYELADKLKDFYTNLKDSCLSFIIGGIFGISENLKKNANLLLSLSKLTFTHEFALLILLEQIYRSFKIIKNEPYHY